MKKITRSQRRNIIEKGKTVLIVFLCVCCVHFMFRIVDLYRGNDGADNGFWGKEETVQTSRARGEEVVKTYWNMAAPKVIMARFGKGNYVFDYGDEDYGKLTELIETVVRELHLKKQHSFLQKDEKEWEKAFEGKGLFVRFGCAHKSDFEAQVLSVGDSGFAANMNEYSELFLSADGNALNVLVRSGTDGAVFAATVQMSPENLNAVMKKVTDSKDGNFVFAQSLNLDQGAQNGVSLSPELLIPVKQRSENCVVLRIPEIYKEGIDFTEPTEFSVNLMNAFGYNPNTVRQYSDSEGRLIFVGETGTVSVSPDGQVEYKALGENDGIPVTDVKNTVLDGYYVVSRLSELNQSILKISGMGNEKNNGVLRMTEFPDLNHAEVKIAMDYYVGNYRVNPSSGHAVEAVIRNGMIVEYKIKVKVIEKTAKATMCENLMSAVDGFCTKNPDCGKITDANIVYSVEADGKETSAVWEIKGE